MSCICQYYAPALNSRSQILPTADEETEENVVDITNASESDDTKIAVCASELASCRAENWLLKKKLHDYEITIENLEQLVATVVDKQHHILGEMFELRQKNQELDTECRLQREYHLVERNALLQQLQEAKTLIYRSTKMLQSTSTYTSDHSETDESYSETALQHQMPPEEQQDEGEENNSESDVETDLDSYNEDESESDSSSSIASSRSLTRGSSTASSRSSSPLSSDSEIPETDSDVETERTDSETDNT
ncbi:uncharacterized protein LOC115621983 isoform X1 [Scaptodrosophila lebanonensis]|uniref:Uncharacterized protein LOC115621983 isoform X1 n=1 Tax=Drosophila lebanonensis TaxID=7225 RepID=A0A6J2T8S1_DROLE|nr:uncharacterized protein LOC115621983 isoform X1 [Scaptodrosophila lebanonensis]